MFGAIGGFVAGLVMAPFIMITAILAGMPPDTMLIAMGLIFGHTFSNRYNSICCFVYPNKSRRCASNNDENGYANESYND